MKTPTSSAQCGEALELEEVPPFFGLFFFGGINFWKIRLLGRLTGSFLLCFDGKGKIWRYRYICFRGTWKNKKKSSTPSQVLLEGSGQQFWLLDGGAPTASRSAPVYHSKARSVGVVMTVLQFRFPEKLGEFTSFRTQHLLQPCSRWGHSLSVLPKFNNDQLGKPIGSLKVESGFAQALSVWGRGSLICGWLEFFFFRWFFIGRF